MSDLQVTIREEGPVKRRLEIRVPATRVSKETDDAYRRLGGRVQIPGFRRGKVPRRVLEERYADDVRTDVVRHLVEETCAEAVRENALAVVASPEVVEHGLTDEGILRYVAVVEIRPFFELGEYKGLAVTRKIDRVEDSHVDAMTDRLRERLAVLSTEEDRVNVAAGDVIEFDMSATADGLPLEKASGTGIKMEVGAGRFPEEFEKGIVGVTRGIETPIDVNFPADHGDPELAGRLVRFAVAVRVIRNKVLPSVDDDFVKDLGWEGCETVDQLRAKIRSDLEAHAVREADQRMRGELLGRLVEGHPFDVPESLVNRQMGATLRDMGISEIPEDKVDEIRAKLEPSAARQVRARFILEAIAKAEALDVTREELEQEVRRQLLAAGADAEKLRQYYSGAGAVAGLRMDMLREKALARLAELATHRDEFIEESRVAVSD
jgi:trigger factor